MKIGDRVQEKRTGLRGTVIASHCAGTVFEIRFDGKKARVFADDLVRLRKKVPRCGEQGMFGHILTGCCTKPKDHDGNHICEGVEWWG
jgi:hypothetical protein